MLHSIGMIVPMRCDGVNRLVYFVAVKELVRADCDHPVTAEQAHG